MQERDPTLPHRYPAPVNDQWDYLLSTIWNQMMHLVIAFDGCLDQERLCCAAMCVMEAEPLLACRFVEADEPYWEEIAGVVPGNITSQVDCVDSGAALDGVLGSALDPSVGPQARLTLIQGKTDTLVISVNHAVCDAFGVRHVSTLLARAYRELGRNPDFRLPTAQAVDRSFYPFLSAFTAEERAVAREACGEQSAVWGIPFEPRMRGHPAYRLRVIDPFLFRRAKLSSQSLGATVNDLLLAAFFAAACKEISHRDDQLYPILTSADLRRILRDKDAPGIANLSVAFEVWFPPGRIHQPATLLREVHRVTAEKKRLLAGVGAAIRLEEAFSGGFFPVRSRLLDLQRRSRCECYPKNPFFSNTGIIPDACADFGDAEATQAFLLPPVEYLPGFSIAAGTYHDYLTLSCGFCEGPLKAETVERLLLSMEEFIFSLTEG